MSRTRKRRQYRGSRRFDKSCRNHGGCAYCRGNRQYASTVQAAKVEPERNAVTFGQVARELTGIDCAEADGHLGWWETSVGASFGARRLAAIKALFEPERVTDDG